MTSSRAALAQLRAANPVPTHAPAPAGTAARRVRPRVLVAAAAGVAAVTIGFGLLPMSHGGASSAAGAALDEAATAAEIGARDPVANPDQYWKITRVSTYLSLGPDSDGDDTSDSAWLERRTRTEYVAVDGARPTWFVDSPGTVTKVFSGSPIASERQGMAWTSTESPNDTEGSWQTPSASWLAGLPRDVGALRDRVYDDTSGHGRSHDGEVLVYVADLLRSGMVPADLRAALFRVLETVPGVDVLRRHDDGLISIGRLETVDGERQEIVIDPATGAFVGEQYLQVDGIADVPAGTVTGESTVTTTVVDDVPQAVRDAACVTSADGTETCP